jgi:hypothetical protein
VLGREFIALLVGFAGTELDVLKLRRQAFFLIFELCEQIARFQEPCACDGFFLYGGRNRVHVDVDPAGVEDMAVSVSGLEQSLSSPGNQLAFLCQVDELSLKRLKFVFDLDQTRGVRESDDPRGAVAAVCPAHPLSCLSGDRQAERGRVELVRPVHASEIESLREAAHQPAGERGVFCLEPPRQDIEGWVMFDGVGQVGAFELESSFHLN